MLEIPLPFHPSLTKPDSTPGTRVQLRVRVRLQAAVLLDSACASSTPGGGARGRRRRGPATSRGAAAPDPAGAMGMEPPAFLSEIFPEEHANLSWLPDG